MLGHFAQHDEWEAAEEVSSLEDDLRHAGRPVRFEVYPRVGHWFAEADRPEAYDAAARVARPPPHGRLPPVAVTKGGRRATSLVVTDSSQLRAARTDPAAFESFYRRWAPALHAWLRTQVPPDAAGDLTAEAFAQALLGLGRFRGREPGAGVAWLWGIARNLVRQHHRRARLERSATERLGISARSL